MNRTKSKKGSPAGLQSSGSFCEGSATSDGTLDGIHETGNAGQLKDAPEATVGRQTDGLPQNVAIFAETFEVDIHLEKELKRESCNPVYEGGIVDFRKVSIPTLALTIYEVLRQIPS